MLGRLVSLSLLFLASLAPRASGDVIGFAPAPFGGHVQYVNLLAKEMLNRGHKVVVMGSKVKYFKNTKSMVQAHPNGTWESIPLSLNGGSESELEYERNFYHSLATATRSGDVAKMFPILTEIMTRNFDASFEASYAVIKRHNIQIVLGDTMMTPTWKAVDLLRHKGMPVEGMTISPGKFYSQHDFHFQTSGRMDLGVGARLGVALTYSLIMSNLIRDFLDGGIWGILGWQGRQFCDLGNGVVGPDVDRKVGGTCSSDIPSFQTMIQHFPIIWPYFTGMEFPRPYYPNDIVTGHLMEEPEADSYKKLEPKELAEWLDETAALYPDGVVVVSFGTSGLVTEEEIKTIFAAFEQFPKLAVLWKTSSLNRETMADIKEFQLPMNVKMESWVDPSMQALYQHPRVVGVVQHGGLSSPMEAFLSGKGVVTVPLLADQKDNSDRLANTGASCSVGLPLATQPIADCVGNLTANRGEYAAAAKRLVKIWRTHGGIRKACDTAEMLVEVGSEHLILPSRRGKRLQDPGDISFAQLMGVDVFFLTLALGVALGAGSLLCWGCLARCCCGEKKPSAAAKGGARKGGKQH